MVNPISGGGQIPAYGSQGGGTPLENGEALKGLMATGSCTYPIGSNTTYNMDNIVSTSLKDVNQGCIHGSHLVTLINFMKVVAQMYENSFPSPLPAKAEPFVSQIDHVVGQLDIANNSIQGNIYNEQDPDVIQAVSNACDYLIKGGLQKMVNSLGEPTKQQENWSTLAQFLQSPGSFHYGGNTYNLQGSINAVAADCHYGDLGSLNVGHLQNLCNAMTLVKNLYQASCSSNQASVPANCTKIINDLGARINDLNALITDLNNTPWNSSYPPFMNDAESINSFMSNEISVIAQTPPPGAQY